MTRVEHTRPARHNPPRGPLACMQVSSLTYSKVPWNRHFQLVEQGFEFPLLCRRQQRNGPCVVMAVVSQSAKISRLQGTS
jgi:hypothetical protein